MNENFFISGPVGNLESFATSPKENKKNITVIICHPHPLFGGTMNNKVVTTLAKTFDHLGCHTVRFNFRGVEKSEGKYSEGFGETEDACAIAKWVQTERPQDELWIAGFSFGSFVALQAAKKLAVKKLILVAPAVENFNFGFEIPVPWILVQGEADEIVSPLAVFEWAEKCNVKPKIIRMENTSHFFHGKLIELSEKLEEQLR